jgi:hypothetical protein
MPAVEQMHAAVVEGRTVDREPDADHGRADREVEIGVVLVPGLLATTAAGLSRAIAW